MHLCVCVCVCVLYVPFATSLATEKEGTSPTTAKVISELKSFTKRNKLLVGRD